MPSHGPNGGVADSLDGGKGAFRGLHGMHAERPIARLTFLSESDSDRRGHCRRRYDFTMWRSANCPKRTTLVLQWWAWSRESNTTVMQVSLT